MSIHRERPGLPPDHASGERFRPFPAPITKKLGLVCAGGGVTGAVYEIGALAALEDRLENASLTDFDVFVGVSAGAYISALLANGVTPALLFRNATRSAEARTDIDDLALFRVNFEEIASRLAKAPFTVMDAAWDYYKNRHETTLTDLVQALGQLLPSGIFHNEGLEAWMRDWLTKDGRTNDFRKLGRTLRIVAVDLDSGNTAAFGCAGHEDVPISQAVAASCAIPGLYRPVQINGVDYIDGGVKKTAHISLAIRERCGLTVCVNPLVPVRFHPARRERARRRALFGAAASRRSSTRSSASRFTRGSSTGSGATAARPPRPTSSSSSRARRTFPRYMRNIMRTSGASASPSTRTARRWRRSTRTSSGCRRSSHATASS